VKMTRALRNPSIPVQRNARDNSGRDGLGLKTAGIRSRRELDDRVITEPPGVIGSTDAVRYGLPLLKPLLFTMATFGVRFVSTTRIGEFVGALLLFVTVMETDHSPVARLGP